MKILEQRILEDGVLLPGNILKVDSFINHMVDPILFMELAREFKNIFADKEIDKIVTMEVSGIAPAFACGAVFEKPVLFAKKTVSKTLGDDVYKTQVHSFTKKTTYDVMISKELLKEGEKVLIIDDFLAKGKALRGLIELCEQAKVDIQGIGVFIEKSFQGGGDRIKEMGYDVHSLAKIREFKNGEIIFD
ncbi:MAG: xanthine phosphoribosyltransferase [Tissierellia bacterium]|nr:xanthine phosphoribosyltransferase [Tissierellia bacterium]